MTWRALTTDRAGDYSLAKILRWRVSLQLSIRSKSRVSNRCVILGGFHHVKISAGTVGQLVDSPIGAIVQWQNPINGWKIFNAEIEVSCISVCILW